MVQRRISPRMTITQILDSMQSIADTEHTGDLENNALKIFSRLTPDNKRTYLRKSLRMFWEQQVDLAQQGGDELMHEIVIDNEIRIDPIEVAKEREAMAASSDYESGQYTNQLRKFKIAMMVMGGVVVGLVAWVASAETHGGLGSMVGGGSAGYSLSGVALRVFKVLGVIVDVFS